MSDSDPPSYGIELPTILSTQRYSDVPSPVQVPLHVGYDSSRPYTSPAAAGVSSPAPAAPDLIYPSALTTPPTTNDTHTTPDSRNDVDPGLHDYVIAHDHGGTAVARRIPEAFPTDLVSLRSCNGHPESLPAYGENIPPGYTRGVESLRKEPHTLGRYLFKFGFIFPLFWLLGALMILYPTSPLAQGTPWRPDEAFNVWYNHNILTEEDKMEFAKKMQEIERKWSKRCSMALALFICVCLAIGVTIFGLVKVGSKQPTRVTP
ncbi:hypothetical protein CPB84DRAFT_1843801 [Gymnopilus junonius]|uniref:Uncharacterized protein n=1 Tax=Gymnopilus junonius TaxID=109634 RepID=A0A9P5TRU2_GYMJU|nr:hypothetical protein CPB84DRAFT_1843801 [Gymnopilus junonius]